MHASKTRKLTVLCTAVYAFVNAAIPLISMTEFLLNDVQSKTCDLHPVLY
jgi:hypothetical protein